MSLSIEALSAMPPDAAAVEIVERKGRGHPDTICDVLAERLSVELSRFYLDRFGLILHHNVDKVLLWGGAARPAFGGGEVLAPIEIYLAGRATLAAKGVAVPVEALAVEGTRAWFRETFHALDAERHVRVHCLVRPGSAELVELFLRQQQEGSWLANDTSCGVGYAPASELETVVLATERQLTAPAVGTRHAEIGEDVKLMGIRDRDGISLTVACAFVDRHVSDLDDYLAKKEGAAALVREAAARIGAAPVAVQVNTADDPARGSVYITVTGTSAEAGDDGEAGRGNRANGLITPCRPMTMESVAGKNPVTHVGKLYNIAAGRIAAAVVDEIAAAAAAECYLVSQIGRPVHEPRTIDVRVRTGDGSPAAALAPRIEEIARDHLARLGQLGRELVAAGGVQL